MQIMLINKFIIITVAIIFILICSFHSILFLFTIIVAAFFGLLFYFELNIQNIENEYASITDKSQPLYLIDSNYEESNNIRNYVESMINNRIDLVQKLEFNRKYLNRVKIDNQLNSLFELINKNHIQTWSKIISPSNDELSLKFYHFYHEILIDLIRRMKRINIADLLINRFIDELTRHHRIYRLTKLQLEYKIYNENEFLQMFFNIERKFSSSSNFVSNTNNTLTTATSQYQHEIICQNQMKCLQFISCICDIIQYELYPCKYYRNETFRVISKQILMKIILKPLINLFSEPDFINTSVIQLLKRNYSPTTEIFIMILQSIDNQNELNAVLHSLDEEISSIRSKDHCNINTGNNNNNNDNDNDVWKWKQQLNSLLYLKKIILSYIKKFDDNHSTTSTIDSGFGSHESNDDNNNNNNNNNSNNNNENQSNSSTKSSLPKISFDKILKHNKGLELFLDYMQSINCESYINLYLNIQTFKISIEQGLFEIYLTSLNDSVTNEQYQQLQNDIHLTAMNIYDTYLSSSSSSSTTNSVNLELIDRKLCDKLYEKLTSNDSNEWMNDQLFDDIFNQLHNILLNHHEFFPKFCQSKHYRRLLGEPDLLRDSLIDDNYISNNQNDPNSNDNNQSIVSNRRKSSINNGYDIEIIDTGILNVQGKSFIGYLINVERKNSSKNSHDNNNNESWTILRRYSEFHHFHQLLQSKCEQYHMNNLRMILILPPKTLINNSMNENFIQYRRYMLNNYLKKLNYLYEKFQFLRNDIERFIQPGNYEMSPNLSMSSLIDTSTTASLISSTTKNLLNPIRTIGNVFRNQSENLLDGFQRLSFRTLSLQGNNASNNNQKSNESINKSSFDTNNSSNNQEIIQRNYNINTVITDYDDYYYQLQQQQQQQDDMNANTNNDENIPLLLLLDEVFDLNHLKHFWLRRRLIELFKQIVEVAYSDTINKKMIQNINYSTSIDNICSYIDSLKNSIWPNGVSDQSSSSSIVANANSENCLRRKIAAKALIMTFMSDLRRVIGNDTLQQGLSSLFELFQQKLLNLRLVIIILFEILLKELLPENRPNNWKQIFDRLYRQMEYDCDNECSILSSSSICSTDIDGQWPPNLSDS